jgi:hypothetical protein
MKISSWAGVGTRKCIFLEIKRLDGVLKEILVEGQKQMTSNCSGMQFEEFIAGGRV